ncbi:uncharacterized protein G2W53_034776 [Senna tora]|uniref:Uncharacterized protein n=1 Tax=Senna tora TaxID=362788 RepID=A0A834W838_9FABA|nr:uncharacterized protein G2W53_034776 [Senna tora]
MKGKEFENQKAESNLRRERGGRRGRDDPLPHEDGKSVIVWNSTWTAMIGQVAKCRCQEIVLWIKKEYT